MNKIWERLGLLKNFDTVEKTWLAKSARLTGIQSVNHYVTSVFFRCFRDPIRVPRIRENRVLRIREIRIRTGPYWVSNIFLKKNLRNVIVYPVKAVKLWIVALHGISEMIVMNRRGCCLHYTYLVWGEWVLDVNWSNNSIQLKLFVVVQVWCGSNNFMAPHRKSMGLFWTHETL